MANKGKAVKPPIGGFVTRLVSLDTTHRQGIAKELAKAVKAGYTAGAIAKAWAVADPSNARSVDYIAKAVLTANAAAIGADFDLVAKALNTNAIDRKALAAWTVDTLPTEYKASVKGDGGQGDGNGGKGGRGGNTNPVEKSSKELEAILARVKAGKVEVAELTPIVNKFVRELKALADAAKGIAPKE